VKEKKFQVELSDHQMLNSPKVGSGLLTCQGLLNQITVFNTVEIKEGRKLIGVIHFKLRVKKPFVSPSIKIIQLQYLVIDDDFTSTSSSSTTPHEIEHNVDSEKKVSSTLTTPKPNPKAVPKTTPKTIAKPTTQKVVPKTTSTTTVSPQPRQKSEDVPEYEKVEWLVSNDVMEEELVRLETLLKQPQIIKKCSIA